jgi:hypothetical protein
MRITELLMYILGVALAVTYALEEFLWCFVLVCLILVVFFIGAYTEGIRFFQWVFLVAFTAHIILVIMDVYSVIALVIYCTFLGFAIIATIIFGWSNFDRVKLSGPYQVGHKDIVNKKDGIAISVWYPMDKDEYEKTIGLPGRNTHWLRYGYKSRKGVSFATAEWGKEEPCTNPWFYKYIDDVKMNTAWAIKS